MDLVGATVLGLHEEAVEQRFRDRLGVLVRGSVGESGPRVGNLALAELVEPQTFASHDEGNDLHLALTAHQFDEGLTLLIAFIE